MSYGMLRLIFHRIFDNILNCLFIQLIFLTKKQDLQLVIRIHPAEVNSTKPAKQRIMDEINKKYKFIPKNIKIIPAEDNISIYFNEIMQHSF